MKGVSWAVAALWSLAVGIATIAFLPTLPGSAGGAVALLFGLVCVVLTVGIGGWLGLANRLPCGLGCLLLPFLFGCGWALNANHHALSERLPLALNGSDHSVTLEVEDLPEVSPAAARFGPPGGARGLVDSRFRARVVDTDQRDLIGKHLLLSWYRVDQKLSSRLRAGSRWKMSVRLKRPRGSVNPHTFDYEAWLLQQGIYATGYVRDKGQLPTFVQAGGGVDTLRETFRDRVSGQGLQRSGLIRALLLGDRSGLDTDTNALLKRTGTAHLLAISGLHVGMVAGFFLLLGGALGRVAGILRAHNPLPLAGITAIGGALVYTLLSGAPLSAQRALVMVVVATAAVVARRRVDPGLAFALALALVLLWQPLAVLNAGFWLSFIAVAVLLLRFQGRAETSAHARQAGSIVGKVHAAVSAQWCVLLGLMVPSLVIFSGVSASALLVNLIAIPWLALVILPLVLMGALVPVGGFSGLLWQLADWQLEWLLRFLLAVDGNLPSWQSMAVPGVALAGLAALASVLLLMPRGFPGRILGWCLIPVVLMGLTQWQRETQPRFELTVLDVGQGLAVVATTEDSSLVFDAGDAAPGGWSAGGGIVAPYLTAQGWRQVDALVVSHGDRDHAGGVEGLAEQLGIVRLVAPGELPKRLQPLVAASSSDSCVAGRHLLLGEMELQWLWPSGAGISGEENDHSCVALLTWRSVRILLTGDISRKAEKQLVKNFPDFEPVDVLIAPHHGSRTSSSPDLIHWASPRNAVFSAGFRHHFGHPHPDVVRRFTQSGIHLFNTADLGAIAFLWSQNRGQPRLQCARAAGRFWFADERESVVSQCAAGM
ncbi:DNA internalization-related competence protein ComEC/Rec2 [Microbulbifer bruguierae]|uniref:DNA internalization-related competence protein ComEC/Rec2 n=1 Tax=Microbulbifer bruguierae TaxID=3029061 RepID=A0ABY8NGL2_9GAMM|nr:DNA internalization-related competence protein ComEC/Rec2 [Microbulbifer bruguierae]WGL17182.1 DNA internalization-related competence protein ComEC/Rec2 [Microbulbifer bruguierae]